jgi:hypothetical protein
MTLFKLLGMCVLFLAIAYAVAAFATLEPNPVLWSVDLRAGAMIAGIAAGIVVGIPIIYLD